MFNMKNKTDCTERMCVLMSLIMSFAAMCGIAGYVQIGASSVNHQVVIIDNILYFILIVPIYIGFHRLFQNTHRRQLILSIFGGIFFSIMLITGVQLDYYSSIFWTWTTFIKIILLAVALCPVIYHLFEVINKSCSRNIRSEEYNLTDHKKFFFKTYCIIFLIWIITYLALFPGVYGYDAPNQILQGLGKIQMSVYQPIVHTFILGKCVKLGYNIFGSYEAGLGIYSLLQLLFMAYVVAKVSTYIFIRTHRKIYGICCTAFFVVFPLHSVFAVSTTKDVIFSGIFALITIELVNMVENPEDFFDSSKKIRYAFLIFALFWFRSNGVYIVAFTFLFMIIFLRKYWKRIFLITFIPIVTFMFIQNALISCCNIGEGYALREMLSIPCQQLARTYTYNEDSFTDEQKQVLFEIIPEETFEVYPLRSTISDNIKGALDTERLKEEPLKYLSLYIDIGLKNPKNYIEASMLNCLGIWYPNKYYQDTRQYHPYIEIRMIDAKSYSPDYLEFDRYSLLPSLNNILIQFFEEAVWIKFPGVSSLFTIGTYVWIVLIFVLYCILKKKYIYLIPISFLLGLIFTIVLGPVSLIRYAYPIIITIPIVIMLFSTITPDKKERK